jgi:hypothetical protein
MVYDTQNKLISFLLDTLKYEILIKKIFFKNMDLKSGKSVWLKIYLNDLS